MKSAEELSKLIAEGVEATEALQDLNAQRLVVDMTRLLERVAIFLNATTATGQASGIDYFAAGNLFHDVMAATKRGNRHILRRRGG